VHQYRHLTPLFTCGKIFHFFSIFFLHSFTTRVNFIQAYTPMTPESKKKNEYARTRAALIHAGHTLRSWALAHGYPVGSVYSAIQRRRHGPKAHAIRRDLATFIRTQTAK